MQRRYTQVATLGMTLGPQGFLGIPSIGDPWFVATDGNDSQGTGAHDPTKPLLTITQALALAAAGDVVYVAPGTYAESFTISQSHLTIVGMGSLGSVIIQPVATTAVAVTVTGQRVTLVNLDVSAAETTALIGVLVNGDGFVARQCKFETYDNAGTALKFLPSAVSGGTASLFKVIDCEFAWCATGINFFQATSTCTQGRVTRCWFHNCSAAAIAENSANAVRNLVVEDCTFDDMEDGSAPTKYIQLPGSSDLGTGIVTRCSFPTAINGGLNLVSTGIHWVCNYHTGGVSTAQPS